MAKVIKEELIKQLALGDFISGQHLGEQLGVSRAAISKHIHALADMGLDVYSVTGRGYKLAKPISLLNQEEIEFLLAEHSLDNKVEIYSLIDSTNSYLLRKLSSQLNQGHVCIAEYQSAGRGRRGRQWISPFGSHIYMSMYWNLEQGMSAAMGLSVVAALAISDAVKALADIDVQLKWPNDIYLGGVKLAGILIDLEGQASESCHSVIGIGLNLEMPMSSAQQVDQPWTDLTTHAGISINRNALCVELIKALTERLKQHQENGITNMVSEWHAQDYYLNKKVKLITGQNVTEGICKGINAQGALMLETPEQIKAIYGGEVSLREADDSSC